MRVLPSRLRSNARAMRLIPTPAEARMWRALRAKQFEGHRFRRQAPIGDFIVDIFCPALRLVIEVDGESHAEPGVDRARDAWLRSQGLYVVHFWNSEIMNNLDGVLAAIGTLCATLPQPPPEMGGGSPTAPPISGGDREESPHSAIRGRR